MSWLLLGIAIYLTVFITFETLGFFVKVRREQDCECQLTWDVIAAIVFGLGAVVVNHWPTLY